MTRVLVVDDDADLRDTLVDLLAEEGYEARSAGDGGAALAELRRAAADVVLLDFMMPRMNAVDFRRAQLGDAAIARVPVVLMTAAPPSAELASIVPSGVLRKPFASVADVVAAIESAVRARPA
jgi:CheY-like chemotaxis protein